MKNSLVPEAVTLTLHGRDTSAYGVCWMTAAVGEPVVQYTEEADARFLRAVTLSATAAEHRGLVRNTAVIRGLEQDKSYRWRVGDKSGVFSPSAVFKTIPADGDSLTFTVYSDSQDRAHYGKWFPAAWRDAAESFPASALSIHCGDIVEEGNKHVLWERMTRHNRGLFCSAPMLPITGNHDHFAEEDGVMHPYFNISSPEDKPEPITYYSVDAGPVHFTMLCSGDYGYTERCGLRPEQIEWAKRDLASTDKPWKVVAIHTPFYSPGKYGTGKYNEYHPASLHAQLNEAFASLGVDLVLAGHDHIFSETFPIGADSRAIRDTDYVIKRIDGKFYRLAVKPEGPVHILPGCAGNQNRPVENEMSAEVASRFKDVVEIPRGCVSYVAVDVKGSVMTAEFVLVNAVSGERVITRRFGISK
ncbi:MAG: metallophosphoesterase family protein [Clostridia bacterium]|nr:metallophosphoesterase family protein [Clostridia bacterium]